MKIIEGIKVGGSSCIQGTLLWRVWLYLGWNDILMRYRLSAIGPFWITINMAVTIYTMGFLYSTLFKIELATYFPYLACGLLVWGTISTVISESLDACAVSKNFILQMQMPFAVYVHRVILRTYIVFLHNIVAIVPVLIYFKSSCLIFEVLFGLVLLYIISFVYGGILGIFGARYNDVKQIINSLLYLLFLTTPILWNIDMLPGKYLQIMNFNPVYQVLLLVRNPLLGKSISLFSYGYALGLIAIGSVSFMLLLNRVKSRIAFWV